MSRWFRLYDDTINDPKILKLPEVLRWYWIALLCVASKCGGNLPPLDDIAIQLRVTQAKATEVLASLVKAGLLDRTETGFVPHNWHGRQYKSSEDKPTKGKDSYVYFVGASWGAMIKIGFSKNPWARLVNIQTSHHEKVVVLAAFRCKSHSEVALHDLLKPYRRQGEWFDLPASVSDTAKRYADERKGYEELVVEIATLLRSATTEAEAEAEAEAETDSEAIASGADAPPDPAVAEREFFARGKQILGKSAGGQLAKLKNAKGGNVALARAVLEIASTKENPAEYIAGAIRSGAGPPIRAMTVAQRNRQETREILDDLDDFARRSRGGGEADFGLLPGYPGERSETLRGGVGGAVVDLSSTGHRESG